MAISKKVFASLIAIVLIVLLFSCNKKGSGSLEDAEWKMTSATGVEISDFELISTHYNPEKEDQVVIDFDGAVFYKGDVKIIEAHTDKYFRGYSKELDSYVFSKYDGLSKQYSYVENYSIKEKDNASKILEKVTKVIEDSDIDIQNVNFSKFEIKDENIDNVYKLPKDFDTEWYFSTTYLHLLIETSGSLDELIKIADSLEQEVNKVEDYIPTHIIAEDGAFVFVYNMEPTKKDKGDFFREYLD